MVNIWALNKDQAIRHVLLVLTEQLGAEAFLIDPITSDDPRTIYLVHPTDANMRVWLHVLGQSENRYGVHLEYPHSIDIHDDLSLAELVAVLAGHFDVPVIHPLP